MIALLFTSGARKICNNICNKVSIYENDCSLEQVVPHGSILVPLLFLLNVNNLKYASDISEYVYCNYLCSILWRHKF